MMRSLRAWIRRLLGVFPSARAERELDAELESHLQLHIDDSLRAGMSPGEARRAAIIALGGLAPTVEAYRDRRGLPLLASLAGDVRYGVRSLARRPGFTLAAIVILGLGIGANSAIFTLVNTVLLRPLPVASPSELVALNLMGKNDSMQAFSYPNYRDYRDRNEVRAATALRGFLDFFER